MRIVGCALVVAFLATTTLTVAGQVPVEYDSATDFKQYRTYQWKTGTPARRPAAEDAIFNSVKRELTNRGLARVDDGPGLYVVTHVLVDSHSLKQLDDAHYWEFVTGITSVDAYDLGSGTLVVDLIDVQRDKVVWRGVATGTVSGPLDKVIRRADKLIARMFRQLPR